MKPVERNRRTVMVRERRHRGAPAGVAGLTGASIRIARAAGTVALAVAAAALTGCLESADTVNFQPGVYQGAPDSLTSDTAALQARFQGQTDR